MNIFVSRLNFKTTDEGLKDLFANYGEVTSAKIINDRESGRSRGFGFVEMSDDEAAKKAIDELNGKEFDGRTIVVAEARPRTERPQRGGYNHDRY
ncbi:MAG: RNA-binding protein [Prevotella sp.]|jgi:RNA recognition motif-containing protein|nr:MULTISPECIES: RNA-binding protein [unclassified Prevotella]MCH3970988.1 RNA-binding protein [Prevotella sp.]MCH3985632.1 RNA-binding protein [Prevotella sp.]MCH3993166.1 RNA-binding protein [Prevotella sp.]MCH4017983.1 RNA-binding protein [Prevotella sp.]MCH4100821.1 RNA-binding protein [Prevotella sp.]